MVKASDLMDQAEIRAALDGMSASSFRAYRSPGRAQRGTPLDGLPEPIRYVSGRPVWDARQVKTWLRRRPTPRPIPPAD